MLRGKNKRTIYGEIYLNILYGAKNIMTPILMTPAEKKINRILGGSHNAFFHMMKEIVKASRTASGQPNALLKIVGI